MSYDPELPTQLDFVRFLVGDTTSPETFSDAELTALIASMEVLYGPGDSIPWLVAADLIDRMTLTASAGARSEETVSKLTIKRDFNMLEYLAGRASYYRQRAGQLMEPTTFHFKVLP